MNNKILQKIRSVIYQFREGKVNKEEGFDKIVDIMCLHQGDRLDRRL